MCERASAIFLAIACCFIHGGAAADSIAEKAIAPALSGVPAATAEPDPIKPIAAPVVMPATATAPAVMPAAVVPPPVASEQTPPRSAAAPGDQRERNRILSYIILQSLQGAGPFVGAR